MKIALEMEINDQQKIDKLLELLISNKTDSQQKINSNSDKKVLCTKCKRDLHSYYDADEAQKIINFCQVKYKGKVYCRDCQETLEAE